MHTMHTTHAMHPIWYNDDCVESILGFALLPLFHEKHDTSSDLVPPPETTPTVVYPRQPHAGQLVHMQDLNDHEADWQGVSQPFFDAFRRTSYNNRIYQIRQLTRGSILDAVPLASENGSETSDLHNALLSGVLGERQTVGFFWTSCRRIFLLCLVCKQWNSFVRKFRIRMTFSRSNGVFQVNQSRDIDSSIRLTEKNVKSRVIFVRYCLFHSREDGFSRHLQVFPPFLFVKSTDRVRLTLECGELSHAACIPPRNEGSKPSGNLTQHCRVHFDAQNQQTLQFRWEDSCKPDRRTLSSQPRHDQLVSGMFVDNAKNVFSVIWQPRHTSQTLAIQPGSGAHGLQKLCMCILDKKGLSLFRCKSSHAFAVVQRKSTKKAKQVSD